MPRLLLAPIDVDAHTLGDITEETARYIPSLAAMSDTPGRAESELANSAALLIILGPNWVDVLSEQADLRRSLGLALGRGDLMIRIGLLEDAEIPGAGELPEDLSPLAYLPQTPLSTDENLPRDIRLIAIQIQHHLRRLDKAGSTGRSDGALEGRRGLPWNVLIIVAALITGLAFIIIPDLRQVNNDPTEAAPPPRSAAANAAIINSQDGLRIGVASALSGEIAGRGQEMLNGVQLAINRRPGVTVDGRRFDIDLLTQDSGCSSEGGIQTAELFVSDISVAGVIGDFCNASCFAAVSTYDEADFTTISPSCDATGLGTNGSGSFNRVVPSSAAVAEAAARYAFDTLNAETVVIISDEDINGTALASRFSSAFGEAGGQLGRWIQVSSSTLDLDAVRSQIEQVNPDLIYIGGNTTVQALTEALSGYPIMLAHNINTSSFISAAGTGAEGLLVYQTALPESEGLQDLRELYTSAFESSPESDVFAYAYDATNVLLDGIEAVGRVDVIGNLLVDHAALQDYVRQYSGSGITGEIDCDGTGNCATAHIAVYRIEDGALSEIAQQ